MFILQCPNFRQAISCFFQNNVFDLKWNDDRKDYDNLRAILKEIVGKSLKSTWNGYEAVLTWLLGWFTVLILLYKIGCFRKKLVRHSKY